MIIKINSKMKKRHGEGFIPFLLWMTALIIFLAAISPKFGDLFESTRRTATIQDMKTLAEQCALYTVRAADGKPPANLGNLVTGLTAAQTVDGIAYGNFLATGKYTSDPASFVDRWDNPYQYDPDARTITSTMNGGTAHTEYF